MSTLPIHQHLAQSMAERLVILTHKPQHICLFGADANSSYPLLYQHYPQARFSEYDPSAKRLAQAQALRQLPNFWHKLTRKQPSQYHQSATTPLPTAKHDFLWANLSLTATTEPLVIIDNWANTLQTNGLLFFTHFGRDSLPEIRALLNAQQINAPEPYLDMHDLGDMLFHHGFYDPVIDTHRLILTYQTPAAFWQDMAELGILPHIPWACTPEAEAIINQAIEDNNLKSISLEILYGHAVKQLQLPQGESAITFHPPKPH